MAEKNAALLFIILLLSTHVAPVAEASPLALIPLITATAKFLGPVIASVAVQLGLVFVAGVAVGFILNEIYDAVTNKDNKELVENFFPVKIVADEQELDCK
jgi:uncharacterized membrane protein (DUF485 family)